MKKIRLILPTLLVASSTTCLPLTSCSSNKYEMSELTKDIIMEMIGSEDETIAGTCSVPHPSYHCEHIAQYLVRRIQAIMGEDANPQTDENKNVICDIPANNPQNKDFEPIILQAHIDMVVAGMSEEESLTRSIEPEIEGKIMHSKDHKTSLGADDGVGIAIILKIMRERLNFEHGLIRCIFSTDEEVGMIGAHNLHADRLKVNGTFIPYLLNIDNEIAGQVLRSCLGSFQNNFYATYDSPTTGIYENAIDVRIDGLKGGHSGVDIVSGRASADRIMFEFVNYLIETKHVNLQIGGYDHVKKIDGQDVDIKWQANQLIQNGRVILYCDEGCDHTKISQYLDDYLKTLHDRYPGEDIDSWSKSVAVASWQETNPYISKDQSASFAKLIGGNIDPDDVEKIEEKGLPYGVLEMQDGRPRASANIGPITITDNKGTGKTLDLSMRILYRTAAYGLEEDPQPQEWSIGWAQPLYESACKKFDPSKEIEHERIESTQPWESIPGQNDQMVNFLDQTYAEMGVEHSIFDPQGGIEIAQWITKNPALICASIGPTLDDVHTTNETLHLDTVDETYNAVLKTLAWVEKK